MKRATYWLSSEPDGLLRTIVLVRSQGVDCTLRAMCPNQTRARYYIQAQTHTEEERTGCWRSWCNRNTACKAQGSWRGQKRGRGSPSGGPYGGGLRGIMACSRLLICPKCVTEEPPAARALVSSLDLHLPACRYCNLSMSDRPDVL